MWSFCWLGPWSDYPFAFLRRLWQAGDRQEIAEDYSTYDDGKYYASSPNRILYTHSEPEKISGGVKGKNGPGKKLIKNSERLDEVVNLSFLISYPASNILPEDLL
jgi:hypothetical protein